MKMVVNTACSLSRYCGQVLALFRCVVPEAEQAGFLAGARDLLAVLSLRAGYLRGSVGQATDEPEQWVIATRWADLGSYRRGLSSYDAKVTIAPLMAHVVNEPSAFEVRVDVDAGTG